MPLQKPARVRNDPVMSAKWDEITAGREFAVSDVPTLTLLCYWYAVVDRCEDDISTNGGIQVAYSNDMSDIKELPQIGTLKKASAEIRALNKQLSITDTAMPEKAKVTKLELIQGKRANRQSKAANSA